VQELSDTEKHLIVDFSSCNYLSSTGIRVLLSSAKNLKQQEVIYSLLLFLKMNYR
jgi:anti-anti-sigma regulatory factor